MSTHAAPGRPPRSAWCRIEHHPALLNATARLAEEFRGTYGQETIERFLHTSYDEFLKNASVTTFLPLLAERFARQPQQIEGPHDARCRDDTTREGICMNYGEPSPSAVPHAVLGVITA